MTRGTVLDSIRLDAVRRARELDELASTTVDLLVIGGGVTGAGIALDAASRGLSVALVERGDLASGTSRWSSKLVHGGLRYLAQGDVALARESARERSILVARTAPHLVRALPMVVPLIASTRHRDGALIDVGHHVSHLLGAGRVRSGLPRPRRLSVADTRALLPALEPEGLRGGLVNYDGQLEDDARLVLCLARTAAGLGARVLTYSNVTQADGSGATVTDVLHGGSLRVRARAVINAAGVWAGTLDPDVRLRPSKGSHLVLRAGALGNPTASMTVAVVGEANRYVFALPHPDGLIYLGITDDPVDGPPPDEPTVSAGEQAFLLGAISRALRNPLTDADVVGSFAGLRPLLAGSDGRTADLSRRHTVTRGSSGLWSVVGGKLTTYRRMAQDAVDAVDAVAGEFGNMGRCRTHDLPLVGAVGTRPHGTPARLVRRYGAEAGDVAALAAADPSLLAPVAQGVPVLGVEFAFGVLAEGALTVEDLLARRTRLSLVPAWAEAARPAAERALACRS